MHRYPSLKWAAILLSSVVTGGGSFVLLTLLTDWPIGVVIGLSVMLVLAGDVVLALMMQAITPTDVTVGPGERWHRRETPADLGAVIDFEDRQGTVSVRGETWKARQTPDCDERLDAGSTVRIVGRDKLTLVVAAGSGGSAASPRS